MVACIASATSLRSHHNCHMEILCPSEGAYPLWPKPGRLSAGYAAAHTDSHAHMCAVFAVHTVLLLCQICQFRAWGIRLLARPLPGQPPLVRIGSPVLGATCAYCATAASFLPVQGMGYPAACATLIRAASARAHRKSRPRCNLACSLC